MGTLGSAGILNYPAITLSKQNLTSISILVSGLCMVLIQSTTDFRIILFVFGIQGFAFGGIDTFANCALPELWKLDVNPWMQSMHASFGIGALVGPALVGRFHFNSAFRFISISSLVPLFGIIASYYCCYSTSIDVDIELQSEEKFCDSEFESKEGVEMIYKDLVIYEPESVMAFADSKTIEGKQYQLVKVDDDHEVNHSLNVSSDVPSVYTLTSALKVTKDVPWDIKALITLFYFVYVGSESGYSGWISMFGLSSHLTESESSAAYLCSFFWTGLTLGRLLAIPQSMYFTASAMVRFQLGLSVLMSVYFLYFPAVSYEETSIVSLLFGFAMSSIFPLMMIIVTDYGYVM